MIFQSRKQDCFFIHYIIFASVSVNFLLLIKYQCEIGSNEINEERLEFDLNEPAWFDHVKIVSCMFLCESTITCFLNTLRVDSKVNNLLKYLHDIRSFLVDIELLNEIQSQSSSSVVNLNFTKYDSVPLVFGINSMNTHLINNEQIKNYGLDCDLLNSNNAKFVDEVISNIYLNCTNIRVQIAVFHKRGDFLYIGQDSSGVTYSQNDATTKSRWFGDVPRAFRNFKLNKIANATNIIILPSNIQSFLFDYGNSKFIECDRELANLNAYINGKKYEQKMTKNAAMIRSFKYFTDFLEENQKHYWLFGGTLLGWFRDCGIIPHTSDMDVGMWATEYNMTIKQKFVKNQKLPLVLNFGFVNDSYELRLLNKYTQIDVFFVYKYNGTYQHTALHEGRKKKRRWLPEFSEVCSAELLQHKVLVPCYPVEYLNLEYGETKNWIYPKKSNYTWNNLDERISNWTEEEWPHAIKLYNMKGFDKYETLKFVNEYLENKLKVLPKDDDI